MIVVPNGDERLLPGADRAASTATASARRSTITRSRAAARAA